MKDDVFVLLFVLTGICLGALGTSYLPQVRPEVVVFGAAAGGAMGVILGILVAIVRADGSRNTSSGTRVTSRSGRAPRRILRFKRKVSSRFKNGNARATAPTTTPFRTRLAEFTDQDVAKVMLEDEQYVSQMPFWSVAKLLSGVRPKSASLIRQYLLAIRRAVHKT
jgi:hypothetical protein